MEQEHAHESHAHPTSMYVKTLLALFILMGATIGASYVPLGSWGNNLVAMGIACIKGTLVILFFMNVKFSTNLIKMFAALGFAWLLIMGFILGDYWTRKYEPAPSWDATDKGSGLAREPGNTAPGDPTKPIADQPRVNLRPRL